jgi:DNA ligase-associated metallophosphoesterase
MTDSEELMVAATRLNPNNDTGCCSFEVAGIELIADPAGVAWWEAEKCLIVSDLHLEKGSSFARRGQMLPPYDSTATLSRLQKSIDYWCPQTVISLGDSFHDGDASARLPPAHRNQLNAMCKGSEWIWILGNHDPEPPVDLAGMVADTLSIGALNFCHEPQVGARPGEVSGHLHPAARLRRQGRSIRRRCFAVSNTRLIMPSFGAYTGGLNVLDRAFDGLFEERNFRALMLGEGQVYQINGQDLR